jgi:hypothetical protein
MFWEVVHQIFLYLTAGLFALLLFIGSITIGYMVGNITAKMLIRLVRWLGRLIAEPDDELIDE